jgi:hypothetical protein
MVELLSNTLTADLAPCLHDSGLLCGEGVSLTIHLSPCALQKALATLFRGRESQVGTRGTREPAPRFLCFAYIRSLQRSTGPRVHARSSASLPPNWAARPIAGWSCQTAGSTCGQPFTHACLSGLTGKARRAGGRAPLATPFPCRTPEPICSATGKESRRLVLLLACSVSEAIRKSRPIFEAASRLRRLFAEPYTSLVMINSGWRMKVSYFGRRRSVL